MAPRKGLKAAALVVSDKLLVGHVNFPTEWKTSKAKLLTEIAGILNADYWDVDFSGTYDVDGCFKDLKLKYGVSQTVPVAGAAAEKQKKGSSNKTCNDNSSNAYKRPKPDLNDGSDDSSSGDGEIMEMQAFLGLPNAAEGFCCCGGSNTDYNCKLDPLPSETNGAHYCTSGKRVFSVSCWEKDDTFSNTQECKGCFALRSFREARVPQRANETEDQEDDYIHNGNDDNDGYSSAGESDSNNVDKAYANAGPPVDATAAGGNVDSDVDSDNDNDPAEGNKQREILSVVLGLKTLMSDSIRDSKETQKFVDALNSHIPEYDNFAQTWEVNDDLTKIYQKAIDGETVKTRWSKRAINFTDVLHAQLFSFVACMAYNNLGISTEPGADRTKQTLTLPQQKSKILACANYCIVKRIPQLFEDELKAYFPRIAGKASLPQSFLDFFSTKSTTESIGTSLLNTAKKCKAFINSKLHPIWFKERPSSGMTEHKYLYFIRSLVFKQFAYKQSVDAVRKSLQTSKIAYNANNRDHSALVNDKVSSSYIFDKHYYPDCWLTYLWVGCNDVSNDRQLDMFSTTPFLKRAVEASILKQLGSADRNRSRLAEATIANQISSTTPSEISSSSSNINTTTRKVIIEFAKPADRSSIESLEVKKDRLQKEYSQYTDEFSNQLSRYKRKRKEVEDGAAGNDADEKLFNDMEMNLLKENLKMIGEKTNDLKNEIDNVNTLMKNRIHMNNTFATPN
jgi:hypothetical protein